MSSHPRHCLSRSASAPAKRRHQPLPSPVLPNQQRVRTLFGRIAPTYAWAEWVSGGLLAYWRRRLVAALPVPAPATPPPVVVDLMAGGAELWPVLRRRLGPTLHGVAVDFSSPMLARAAPVPGLALRCANALATGLPGGSATAVTCAFGLKTLAPDDYPALTAEAARLLRPGGCFVLVELAVPRQGALRWLFNGYWALLSAVARRWVRRAVPHAALAAYAASGPALPALERALGRAGFGPMQVCRLWPGCAVRVSAILGDG